MTPTLFDTGKRRARVALFTALVLSVAGVAAAHASVTIDGDLTDMAGFAEALRAKSAGDAFVEQDATGDVRVFDPDVIAGRPIADYYFANGFDQTLDVFAYDRGARTLYLAVRVAGMVGDADGDGNPDANSAEATLDDEGGIGARDRYVWMVRGKGASAGRVVIEVAQNAVTVHGATVLASAFAFRGSELEVSVSGIDLPESFEARVSIGSSADGLGEDTHTLGMGDEAPIAMTIQAPALEPGDMSPVDAQAGGGTAAAAAEATVASARGIDGATATDGAVQADLNAAAPMQSLQPVSDGIAVLGRAYPNPFAASVTFGFEVKREGQSVDVAVYDVTGRVVTKLVSGPQSAGRSSVRWDGKDDGGVRMAPGVYFLKAIVGGVEKVQRLVRIDG